MREEQLSLMHKRHTDSQRERNDREKSDRGQDFIMETLKNKDSA